MESQVLSAASEIDFSMLSLFFRATFTVKIVMVVLIWASIWSWAIIIKKTISFRIANRRADLFDRMFWSGDSLDLLYHKTKENPKSANELIFLSAMEEWEKLQHNQGLIGGVQYRIERSMDVAISRESDRLNSGLIVLATIGSTAPFIGLFGTVWGIKNAFEEIALQQNTNLAVVAPGIAEALVATALGLLAAIPAVVFYNKLSSNADSLMARYDMFSDEFMTILSRQLDG